MIDKKSGAWHKSQLGGYEHRNETEAITSDVKDKDHHAQINTKQKCLFTNTIRPLMEFIK